MKDVGIEEEMWYEKAQDRREWYVTYSEGTERHQDQSQRKRKHQEARTVECTDCRRMFRREADKARHKCVSERARPVEKQRGAVQCDVCGRWFRSGGGLAVHRCSPERESQSQSATQAVCVAEL